MHIILRIYPAQINRSTLFVIEYVYIYIFVMCRTVVFFLLLLHITIKYQKRFVTFFLIKSIGFVEIISSIIINIDIQTIIETEYRLIEYASDCRSLIHLFLYHVNIDNSLSFIRCRSVQLIIWSHFIIKKKPHQHYNKHTKRE